jgi:hypothetical protein
MERLRLGVMATHEPSHLEQALGIFERVGKEFEVI